MIKALNALMIMAIHLLIVEFLAWDSISSAPCQRQVTDMSSLTAD